METHDQVKKQKLILAQLDTACHPTHIRVPTQTMNITNNYHTQTATGHKALISHRGPTTVKIGTRTIQLQAVAVPTLKEPLISAYQIAQHFDILLQNSQVHILPPSKTRPQKTIVSSKAIDGRYYIPISNPDITHVTDSANSARTIETTPTPRLTQISSTNSTTLPLHLQKVHTKQNPTILTRTQQQVTTLTPSPPYTSILQADYYHYHKLFNHIHPECLHTMAKLKYPGLPSTLQQTPPPMSCSGCAVGKLKRAPFNSSKPSPLPGQSIASDTCEWDIKSRNGYKHFATFLDESTGYLQVILLTHRKNIKQHIKPTLTRISLHTDVPIQQFRTDNAKEYQSQDLIEW